MSANPDSPAPTGRNKPAQGNALGHASQNTSSAEGAKESGELPKGWSWKSLAEVAADGVPILYGILQPGPDTPGGVPYVRPTEIVEDVIDLSSIRRTTPAIAGKYKRSVLKPDDVILSIVGTIGKVAVVPPDLDGGNITQSSVRVRPRSEVVLPRYVAWVLRSPVLRSQFDKHRLGTAVPRLNVAHVRVLRVPVPPLPEQHRIVAEIEKQFTRLEAGVAALRRVQANLKRYRAAVLKAACEGRLVPTEAELRRTADYADGADKKLRKSALSAKSAVNSSGYETGAELLARILTERRKNWTGRGQYKEPAAPNMTDLPSLPEGWTYVSVETVGFVQLGRQRAPKHHTGANMRPYLRVANVYEDRIDLSDVKEMNFTPEEFEIFRLKPNDILLNEGQSLELVGRPALYRDELPGACFTNTLVRFRPCPSLNVKFALSVLRAFMHSGRFQKIANWTTNIAHLGADRFAKLAFPLPPLAEQTRIVAEVERRLSVVEELESVVTANLQRAARLRQSILQKAFTGELLETERSTR